MIVLKAAKVAQSERLTKEISNLSVIIAKNNGVTSDQMSYLRDVLHSEHLGNVTVVKNSIIPIILSKSDFASLDGDLCGQHFLFYSTDIISLMKKLSEFLKDNEIEEKLKIQCGYVEKDQLMNATDLDIIAKLPSKAVLTAKIGLLAVSPMLRIAGLKMIMFRIAYALSKFK